MTAHPGWTGPEFFLGADGYVKDRYAKD